MRLLIYSNNPSDTYLVHALVEDKKTDKKDDKIWDKDRTNDNDVDDNV